MDNKSAFDSGEYDRKIKQTLPYYDVFYKEVIELVKTLHHSPVTWLDIGCETGKMGNIAFETVELEKFVFCDASDEMIRIAKERFSRPNAEFSVCDVQNLAYANEFDVIIAIQVNHYLQMHERKLALRKCYEALKENGVFISFENFAPFTDAGKSIYLEKWKRYQMKQGKLGPLSVGISFGLLSYPGSLRGDFDWFCRREKWERQDSPHGQSVS